MEISSDLVYNKELRKLAVTGTYPQDDNCYSVQILDANTKDIVWVSDYFPRPAFDMWTMLNKNKNNISMEDMEETIRTFNEYGQWKYNEASYDADI